MRHDSTSNASEVVDYRDLVGRFPFAEHARRADEYFAGHDAQSTTARKPFSTLEEAGELAAAIGAVLADLNLFSGETHRCFPNSVDNQDGPILFCE